MSCFPSVTHGRRMECSLLTALVWLSWKSNVSSWMGRHLMGSKESGEKKGHEKTETKFLQSKPKLRHPQTNKLQQQPTSNNKKRQKNTQRQSNIRARKEVFFKNCITFVSKTSWAGELLLFLVRPLGLSFCLCLLTCLHTCHHSWWILVFSYIKFWACL